MKKNFNGAMMALQTMFRRAFKCNSKVNNLIFYTDFYNSTKTQ